MTVRYPSNARNTFSRLSEDVSEWQHGNLCGHFFSRHHSPLLEHLLKYPDAPFLDADACILKADRKTALALTSFDGKQFVVKRYNVANIFHRIRLAFQSSRAKKNFAFAKLLGEIGVPSIQPVAWVQERVHGLRARSWFIYEHIDDEMSACSLTDQSDVNVIDHALSQMAQNLMVMRTHRISHGDMKPPNLLHTRNGAVLIDLDAMRQHKSQHQYDRALAKDISRWMRWWRSDNPQPMISQKSEKMLKDAGFQVPGG